MSLWGSVTGSDAAARAKTGAYNQANAYNDEGYALANGALSPYAAAGGRGMDALSALMLGGGNVSGRLDSGDFAQGEDPGAFSGVADLMQDPGYQARMNAAQDALSENQFLDGTWGSGAAAKEMAGYMQEQGSQEYDDAFNRAMNTYNAKNNDFNQDRNFGYQQYLSELQTMTGDVDRQQSLASTMLGPGFNAAGGMAQNANQWAQNAGNNALGVGNAQAEGAVNGSLWSGANALVNLGANGVKLYNGVK